MEPFITAVLLLSGYFVDLKNSKTPKIKAYCHRYLLYADTLLYTMDSFLKYCTHYFLSPKPPKH